MVAVKHFAVLLLILVVLLGSRGGTGSDTAGPPAGPPPRSLFAQSAAQSLNRNFPSSNVSYLLLDAKTGQILASRWESPDTPISLGSLDKPFTALAYGERHHSRYPAHICRGTASGCWRPAGHGKVDLTSAIAYSCNSYFRMLTADMRAADVSTTVARFALESPAPETSGAALAGLGPGWRVSPLRMARAYTELLRQQDNPVVEQILAGMAESAQAGTGAEVDRMLGSSGALVKTGTAPCTHRRHAPGDGFTVVLAPADDPKILLMVRVHGVPGAQAAGTAGMMLRAIAAGR